MIGLDLHPLRLIIGSLLLFSCTSWAKPEIVKIPFRNTQTLQNYDADEPLHIARALENEAMALKKGEILYLPEMPELPNFKIEDRRFDRIHFHSANLSHAKFKWVSLKHSNFNWTDLSHANLYLSDVTGATFIGANLEDALLPPFINNLNFTNATLTNVYLHGANIEYANLHNSDFTNAYLRLAHLRGVNAPMANFERADVSAADFRFATLTWAKFKGAELEDTVFFKVDAGGADFSKSLLTRVTFKESCLSQANFEGSILRIVDFTNADLRWADFRGADLSKTRLVGVKLRRTRYNDRTKFPKNYHPDDHDFQDPDDDWVKAWLKVEE
jgi:uncharacterized protein YjbI with pentapeptide repeats